METKKHKTILLNRGTMTYRMPPLVPGGPVRELGPGGSIEAKDEAEAKSMLDYPMIADAGKIVPQTQVEIDQLRDTVANLTKENEELKKKAAPVTKLVKKAGKQVT